MSPDASLIREIMARECDTVNHYVALAARAVDENVRALILHLAREEKEHIAECSRSLAALDPEYAQLLQKPFAHALDGGQDAQPAPPPSPPAAAPGLQHHTGAFTIGSLIVRAPQEKSK